MPELAEAVGACTGYAQAWSILHPPSSILHPPSSILHPSSSIPHPPSSILYPPSQVSELELGVRVWRLESGACSPILEDSSKGGSGGGGVPCERSRGLHPSSQRPSSISRLQVQGGSGGVPCERPRGLHPPWESSQAPKLAYLASSWRSWAPSWHQDATTSPKIFKKLNLGANIFQHSPQNPPKTASRTLQRDPNPPKNHQK